MGAAYDKGPRSKLLEDLSQCLPVTLADRRLRDALVTTWKKDRLRDFNLEEQGPTSGSRTTSSTRATSRGRASSRRRPSENQVDDSDGGDLTDEEAWATD